VGTDADRPTGLFERGPWPAQSDIHRVAAACVDWANGFNFLPLDVPRHQATIKNSALIQREDNGIIGSTPAKTMHEKGNAEQPSHAEPFHERNGRGHAGCCGRRGSKKNKAGDADLGGAPYEGSSASLADLLRLLHNIAPG
jgi:hypothetical protein